MLQHCFLSLAVGAVGDGVGVCAFGDGGGFVKGVVGWDGLIYGVNHGVGIGNDGVNGVGSLGKVDVGAGVGFVFYISIGIISNRKRLYIILFDGF